MIRYILLTFQLFLFVGLFSQSHEPAYKIQTDTSGDVHPWSHLKVNDPPGNFQFSIVTDRTGGHRPGVFEDAIGKLNLLQPEFVVSVGDLIEGYTEDENRINKEWDEFNGFIAKLQMPFFYIPGNHDYINDVMARIWKEKYGSSYYHFVYKDVLFLCLNSEEATKGSNMGGIEKPQYEYIQKALDENPYVRWTLVFMHQPLWILDNTRHWKDVEGLLKSRKHTVFAGHHHHYVKYERNKSNYFMLATTGGTSKLRGPNFGEFDHMVWVTMTDDGPIIANLLLEGIWDENVVTEELSGMINAKRIKIDPIFVDNGFEGGEFKLKITNDANYPMSTILRFGDSRFMQPEFTEIHKTISPNSVELLKIPVSSIKTTKVDRIKPIPLYAFYRYEYEDGRDIQTDKRFSLAPVKKRYVKVTEEKITLDGDLKDWAGLPHQGGAESTIGNNQSEYQGDFDSHYDFNICYDEENLYLGMMVWDDEVEVDHKKSLWDQDAVQINIDPRPLMTSANERTNNNRHNQYFYLLAAPSLNKKQEPLISQAENLPEGTRLATKKTLEGFSLELSIPLEYVQSHGGVDWETLRVNLTYLDRDGKSPRSSIWWQPNWSASENYIGSGMFFRNY